MNTRRETLTFDVSDNDHDDEAVVVGVVGVVNAGGDLTGADDFLQGDQHQLHGQEGHTFIEEVQWAVEDQVPVFGYDREKIRYQGKISPLSFRSSW